MELDALEVIKVSLSIMFLPLPRCGSTLHGDLEDFPQTLLAIWGSYLDLGALKVTRLCRKGLAPSELMFGFDAAIVSVLDSI